MPSRCEPDKHNFEVIDISPTVFDGIMEDVEVCSVCGLERKIAYGDETTCLN